MSKVTSRWWYQKKYSVNNSSCIYYSNQCWKYVENSLCEWSCEECNGLCLTRITYHIHVTSSCTLSYLELWIVDKSALHIIWKIPDTRVQCFEFVYILYLVRLLTLQLDNHQNWYDWYGSRRNKSSCWRELKYRFWVIFVKIINKVQTSKMSVDSNTELADY